MKAAVNPLQLAAKKAAVPMTLALDETFDAVRSGARLILKYDAPSNSFKGTVENTTNGHPGSG